MRKPIVIGLLLLAVLHAHADSTTRCLRGQDRSNHCARVIQNYWRHEQAIRETAERFGLEPALLKALVATESQYNAQARSRADARGLTQVLPSTAKDLGVADPHTRLYDPHVSLAAGAAYLRQMYLEFRDWRLALAAYNAGPGAVRRHKGIPPYRETQQYVVKVLALYQQFALADAQLANVR